MVLYPLEARCKEGNGNTLQYSCLENPVGRSPRKWNRNTLSTRMQSGNTAIIVHHLQLTVMLSVYPNPAMAESTTPLEYVLFAALLTRKKATVNKTVCPQVCVVRCLV